MITVYPDYFNRFRCTADRCRHTCCAGWEIDVDENTLQRYLESGEDFISNIKDGSFILRENERCPYLNDNNLCEIIINHGEDWLCDICRDHPRFRNFFENRTEIGLGLCCEAACRLILENKEKVTFITEGESESAPEEETLFVRRRIFDILQNRELPYSEREKLICDYFTVAVPSVEIRETAEYLLNLEILDSEWQSVLEKFSAATGNPALTEEYDILREQLAHYFVFRHFSDCRFDGLAVERLLFALTSVRIIEKISASLYGNAPTFEEIENIARMYSAEIEYSDENVNAMLDKLMQ